MSLIYSFEKTGLYLFRFRGQIPIVLFLSAIPVIYFSDYSAFTDKLEFLIKIFSIFISCLGLIIRIITIGTAAPHTSGRNTNEQVAESLNTTGIYSTIRHPLYLGNYLMWAGITIYVIHFWFFIVISLFYWLYYERIMFAEERFLEKKFGKEYLDWSLNTPAFIPSFKNYTPGKYKFNLKRVLSKEYSGYLIMVLSFVYIQTLQDLFLHDEFIVREISLIMLGKALIIAMTLRVISKSYWKHHRV